MVYFTCNICGESIKKNKVNKHCETKCRNAWFFTCMDCNKVFAGFEFESHTSCITEKEKYSGNFLRKQQQNHKLNNISNGEHKSLKLSGKRKKSESLSKNGKNCWMGWDQEIKQILKKQIDKSLRTTKLFKKCKVELKKWKIEKEESSSQDEFIKALLNGPYHISNKYVKLQS